MKRPSKFTTVIKTWLVMALLLLASAQIVKCSYDNFQLTKKNARAQALVEQEKHIKELAEADRRAELEQQRLNRLETEAKQQRLRAEQQASNESFELAQKQHTKKAQCKTDARCTAYEHTDAIVECQRRVERLAKYQYRWTDGIFESKFSGFVWVDNAHTSIMAFGDHLELQNAFGAWQNHTYHCQFRADDGTIIGAVAIPGRL